MPKIPSRLLYRGRMAQGSRRPGFKTLAFNPPTQPLAGCVASGHRPVQVLGVQRSRWDQTCKGVIIPVQNKRGRAGAGKESLQLGRRPEACERRGKGRRGWDELRQQGSSEGVRQAGGPHKRRSPCRRVRCRARRPGSSSAAELGAWQAVTCVPLRF